MTTATAAISGERWLDEVLLVCNFTNIDGDFVLHISPPAGFGDCAIMEVGLYAGPLATTLASPELYGGIVKILNPSGSTNVDILGVYNWTRGVPVLGYVGAYVSPDPLVLWRQGEILAIEGQEVDTNATPTVDFAVFAKVVRVRSVESAPGPVRLVR